VRENETCAREDIDGFDKLVRVVGMEGERKGSRSYLVKKSISNSINSKGKVINGMNRGTKSIFRGSGVCDHVVVVKA
jgi:hypothetical protein